MTTEPPPPRTKAMGIVRWAIIGFTALVAAAAWIGWARERAAPHPATTGAAAPKYRCPMHPQVVSNEPGECPICHMDLVPIEPEDAAPPPPPADAVYTCPMHPEIRQDHPGRCPICKMPLELVPPSDAGAPASPPGTTPIQLSLDRIQSIGVRTAVAEEGATSAALRVTAIVEEPEQGAAQVHVRSPGFVEAIHVDQTGKLVRAGQPLLSLYSPEILQAESELLVARSWGADASALPGAARTKLELLGMTASDIDEVLATRTPIRAVSVVAPRTGFVTKKNVVLGSYVTPETTLYEIQDLSHVYVVADVFLRDLDLVKVGTEARFVPSGHPGDATTGKIDLVYPLVNAEARTRRVRMQLANEGGKKFAPGEYGTVEIAAPSRRAVTVPRDALVDTGTATYVFLVMPEGRFVPRTVTVAGSEGDRVVVDSGLAAGDRVVSGATFLIDSESRLRASMASEDRP